MDKPHSKHTHIFAVVRYDLQIDSDHPGNSVAVVKVL